MMNILRSFKFPYQIFNFFNKSQLQYNMPHYKKYGLDKKYHSPVSSEDFKNIESPLNRYDAKDSSVEMPKDPDFNSLDEDIKPELLSWSENGYVVLKNFFSEQEIDSFNKEVERLIENK